MPAGYDHKYTYTHIGYNLKPLDLQAAMGVEQLDKLPSFIERRRHNFKVLYEALSGYEDLLILPKWSPRADPSWFAFPLTVRRDAPFGRREIVDFLEGRKIETRLLFSGNLLRHPAYRNIPHRVSGPLDTADLVIENTFFVGVFPGMTDEKLAYVAKALRDFLEARRRA